MSGSMEVVVFPSVLKKFPAIWEEDKVVLIDGKVNDRDGEVKILADKVRLLGKKDIEMAKQDIPKAVQINIPENANPDLLEKLKPVIINNLGSTEVFINIPYNGQSKKIKAKSSIAYHPEVLKQIEMIVGNGSITKM